jgi:hypothetical protein
MSKLDEIEAYVEGRGDIQPDCPCCAKTALLIRAVRQLGAVADWADFVAVECESGVIETECGEDGVKLSRAHHDKRIAAGIRRHWNKIDPEVMELIGGEE